MEITKEKFLEIRAKLQNPAEIQGKLLTIPVDLLAQAAGPKSRIGVATISLKDAAEVACEADFALEQAHVSIVYYREECDGAPNESYAVHFGKFYADDVALRLYAAGEHVANFIISLLNIPEADLEPYKEKYTSLQAAVGRYMFKEHPDHRITAALKNLMGEKRWYQTIEYRNIWVHEQPPLIDGLGIVYKRKNAVWSPNRFIGGGDQPEYNIDTLLDMVTAAAQSLLNLLRELSGILDDEIRAVQKRK